jgi:hypothetical protein
VVSCRVLEDSNPRRGVMDLTHVIRDAFEDVVAGGRRDPWNDRQEHVRCKEKPDRRRVRTKRRVPTQSREYLWTQVDVQKPRRDKCIDQRDGVG